MGATSVPESLSTLPSLYILRKGEKSLATSLLKLESMEVDGGADDDDDDNWTVQDFLCGREGIWKREKERCVNEVGLFGFGHKDMVRP